jgi:hypothetical protein
MKTRSSRCDTPKAHAPIERDGYRASQLIQPHQVSTANQTNTATPPQINTRVRKRSTSTALTKRAFCSANSARV